MHVNGAKHALFCLICIFKLFLNPFSVMPVYSKIQQLRDERRREQKRKWKEKQPKSAKKKSETQAAIQKRKQREKVAIIKKNEEKKESGCNSKKTVEMVWSNSFQTKFNKHVLGLSRPIHYWNIVP